MKIRATLAALFLVIVFSETAFAQAVTVPPARTSPFGKSVTGFMQLSIGLTYMPVLNLTSKSQETDTTFSISNERANIPGYSASILLIPTWGRNGITFGASYDRTGAAFNQKAETTYVPPFEGHSSLGFSDFTARVGYARYFGEYQWHPYLMTDVGVVWEAVDIASSYPGEDDIVKEARKTTGLVSGAFGVAKEISNGIVGGEIRLDYYPIPATIDFQDPVGKNQIRIDHPMILKLMLIFAIGQL